VSAGRDRQDVRAVVQCSGTAPGLRAGDLIADVRGNDCNRLDNVIFALN
jgi:hypothetical protein